MIIAYMKKVVFIINQIFQNDNLKIKIIGIMEILDQIISMTIINIIVIIIIIIIKIRTIHRMGIGVGIEIIQTEKINKI